MNQSLQPPQPVYIFRGHASQIHGVRFWRRNTRLITGDSNGWIVIWDVMSRRPVAVWQAHSASILAIEIWGNEKVITHGRDDAIRVWSLPESAEVNLSTVLPAESNDEDRPIPWLLHSLRANTTNFCPMAICEAPLSSGEVEGTKGLYIGAPSKKLGFADIFRLPKDVVEHEVPASPAIKPSMQMAMKLVILKDDSLCLVTTAESGAAIVQVFSENVWTTVYCQTSHTQPVLGVDIAPGLESFYTCGADSIIAKHPLPRSSNKKPDEDATVKIKTGHSGQQSLTVRSDELVFATAGWDSRIRVYSAKTLKEVAVLKWHKEGCYAVAFGTLEESSDQALPKSTSVSTESSNSLIPVMENKEPVVVAANPGFLTVKQRREQKTMMTHWIAAGSKDGKVSLWEIF